MLPQGSYSIERAELKPMIDSMRESWVFSFFLNSEQEAAFWGAIHEAFMNAPDEMFEYEHLSYYCPFISDTLFCTNITLGFIGEDKEHGGYEYSTEVF